MATNRIGAPYEIYGKLQVKESVDIEAALYDYVLEFTNLEAENIFQGYQNRAFLPNGSNNFAVVSFLYDTRQGTNYYSKINEQGIETIFEYKEAHCQIDMYGNSKVDSNNNMRTLQIAWRSERAVDFMATRGIYPHYANDVRCADVVDESSQYVDRLILELVMGYYVQVEGSVEHFITVEAEIVNVDVKFPPKQ